MAIQVQGNGGVIAEVDGTTFRALRVVARPIDYGAYGQYQVSAQTGAIAAGMAADGSIYQLRWSDATRIMLLHRLFINGMRATTAFAAGAIDIKGTIARGFTATGTGGTSLSLTSNNNKLRTSMGTSLMGEIKIASTAALGNGTWTLDVNNLGIITTHSSGGVGSATPIIGSIYLPIFNLFEQDMSNGESPVVFVQNEGINIRATVPATGVWNIGVTCEWSEVASF